MSELSEIRLLITKSFVLNVFFWFGFEVFDFVLLVHLLKAIMCYLVDT